MAIETQLEAMTDDYFQHGGKKVQDLYTETSFVADYFLKQKKGNYDTHAGGRKIKIPLRYDGNKAGFFIRGETLDSTKAEAITAVYLPWRYVYGNATIYQIDVWENDGPEQKVNLLVEEIEGAQIGLNKVIATSLYEGLEADTHNLTGFNAICDTTATQDYAEYCSNDIVSADGTQVWTGLGSSTTTTLSLDAIRTIRTAAAYGEGKLSEPDLIATTEANFNTIKSILQVSQMFTEGVKTAKAGFSGVHFEGADIFPDRYCPTDNMYAFNTKHVGFTVNPKALFKRQKWQIIADSPGDRTMKLVFGGNFTCNNRRSCYRHEDIS
jgi:hypothetical protein